MSDKTVKNLSVPRRLFDLFFSGRLDLRIRLFHVLAMGGMVISLATGVVGVLNNADMFNIAMNLLSSTLSFAILMISQRTGRYQLCYFLTIIGIFIGLFPFLFFSSGGYHGGTPSFFVFAVVFTIFMLEGKKAIALSVFEVLFYVALCIAAYRHPEWVTFFELEREVMTDVIIGIVAPSAVLGVCLYLHFRLYNIQQRDLEAARKDALRLSEVKNIFMANMSHEIRTPINIMLGMTDMVLRSSRDETINAYARKIQNAGKTLLVLVGNILDISKIESGKAETHETRYRTVSLIQELYEIGAESARRRDLAFDIQADSGIAAEFFGDMQQIKQIVTNFLSNSAKYTSAGSITLKFGMDQSGTENWAALRVSVSDTGVGIREEDLSILFDLFTRVDSPVNQSIDGAGLGLAIAKQLAEGMNGKISVKSEYGAGSTFTLELPQKITDASPIGDWKADTGNGDDGLEESFTAPDARILVVDDNIENLQTVKALLLRTLMHVDLADSGAACLAAAENEEYHLILMDYMMPDMDGIETLKRLRENGCEAPVIALTANAVAGTEETLLKAGFAAYIAKPARTRALEEIIAEQLVSASAPVTKRTVYPQTWVTPDLKRILTADLDSCGVSLEDGLKNAGGDLSLLARMAEVFVRNCQDSGARMQSASGEDLRRAAHSLKSAAAYVGAVHLSMLARLIEDGCKDGDNEIVRLTLPVVFYEWERIKQALARFAAHVRAVEPKARGDADENVFDAKRLARYIDNRVRRKAVRELDLAIARKGADCPAGLTEARLAVNDLDFDRAGEILRSLKLLD
jgi:signal transduction histidine kinase/DNA-binding NarL/FixJ family response regulator/HPt (histidine-containing phosphotransfer) domain-containing protein